MILENRTSRPMINTFNLVLACAHAVKFICILAPTTVQRSDIVYYIALVIARGVLLVQGNSVLWERLWKSISRQFLSYMTAFKLTNQVSALKKTTPPHAVRHLPNNRLKTIFIGRGPCMVDLFSNIIFSCFYHVCFGLLSSAHYTPELVMY